MNRSMRAPCKNVTLIEFEHEPSLLVVVSASTLAASRRRNLRKLPKTEFFSSIRATVKRVSKAWGSRKNMQVNSMELHAVSEIARYRFLEEKDQFCSCMIYMPSIWLGGYSKHVISGNTKPNHDETRTLSGKRSMMSCR